MPTPRYDYQMFSAYANKKTGNTEDSYTTAVSWVCAAWQRKTILIKNTDSANSLDYKVSVFAYPDGIEFIEVDETTLAAGDIAKIVLNYAYFIIKVYVKSSTAGNSASYQIDYVGNR